MLGCHFQDRAIQDCDFRFIGIFLLSFFGLLALMKQAAYWNGSSVRELMTASGKEVNLANNQE